MQRRIYLDYNASTPIDPAVVEAMQPLLADHHGNPSSGHWASAHAKPALDGARGPGGRSAWVRSEEVVFTSGGSEANNLALKGVVLRAARKGRSHHHDCHRTPGHP